MFYIADLEKGDLYLEICMKICRLDGIFDAITAKVFE